jgi:hypothetical protein
MAVIYADVPGPVHAKGAPVAGVEWRDEFGQPLDEFPLDVAGRPVVVAARGMGPTALFNMILKSLR